LKAETYYLETFGCQMNVLDSELVAGQLQRLGLRPVRDVRTADVILYNTCSVRQHAEDKVLSRLGHLRRIKDKRPHVVIGVLGCMAERQQEDLFVSTPHLDLLCGPGELNQLPALLADVWARHDQVAALAGTQSRRTAVLQRALEHDSVEALDLSRGTHGEESPLQAYVRVQRGCDKFCTYCVVPFVRGKERSRPPEHIVAECRQLAAQGCREITLLGQTVNSYAYLEGGAAVGLARLLERVHEVEGLDRIRFVTSYPADWDDEIFRVMRDYPRAMPYLHIPAQSGSDRMLKAMKRGYTVAAYLDLMDRARKFIPDIALAGDFIVGFCGETDADFEASVALVQRVCYKSIFVFKYSPRPGTAAERGRDDDVPQAVKEARNHELLAVQEAISQRLKARLVGQTVDVLVEGYSKPAQRLQAAARGDNSKRPHETAITASPNQLIGRTPHDMITVFDGRAEHIGAIARVRITDASALTLFGQFESVVSPARPRQAPALPILDQTRAT
jgi:tRNA-2-methylthio-N6-dimethylallyladenosine synthase